MAGMTAYILDEDGYLLMARSGDVDNVMLAIEIEQTPYTLQPPPGMIGRFQWVDNQWIENETAN